MASVKMPSIILATNKDIVVLEGMKASMSKHLKLEIIKNSNNNFELHIYLIVTIKCEGKE